MANLGIGPFAVGEVPSALQYQFIDNTGAPLILSGGTATIRIHGATRSASIFDSANGIVQYLWESMDLVAGASDVQFTVVQGSTVTKSVPMTLLCRPAIA